MITRVKSDNIQIQRYRADTENHEQINETTSDEASTGGWKTSILEEEIVIEKGRDGRTTDRLAPLEDIASDQAILKAETTR